MYHKIVMHCIHWDNARSFLFVFQHSRCILIEFAIVFHTTTSINTWWNGKVCIIIIIFTTMCVLNSFPFFCAALWRADSSHEQAEELCLSLLFTHCPRQDLIYRSYGSDNTSISQLLPRLRVQISCYALSNALHSNAFKYLGEFGCFLAKGRDIIRL